MAGREGAGVRQLPLPSDALDTRWLTHWVVAVNQSSALVFFAWNSMSRMISAGEDCPPRMKGGGGRAPPHFFMHVTQVNVTLSGLNATVSLPRGQLALHAWDSSILRRHLSACRRGQTIKPSHLGIGFGRSVAVVQVDRPRGAFQWKAVADRRDASALLWACDTSSSK